MLVRPSNQSDTDLVNTLTRSIAAPSRGLPLLNSSARRLLVLVATLMFVGCSMTVPAEKVYGTYVASYPFGTETITLNRDGTFVQSVVIGPEQPATVRGAWEFDSGDSRATFHGFMIVTDGFDHVRTDWRVVAKGLVSLDIEEHWFRVVMGSASTYPYIKQ
jgi:hypothetical protein